jgi:hypothetical protein
MMDMQPSDLVSLVAQLRDLGVTHLKVGEVEVTLGPQPAEIPEEDLASEVEAKPGWRGISEDDLFGQGDA